MSRTDIDLSAVELSADKLLSGNVFSSSHVNYICFFPETYFDGTADALFFLANSKKVIPLIMGMTGLGKARAVLIFETQR